MFNPLKIIVVFTVVLCILVSLFNILLVIREMMHLGIKARIYTLLYMIAYLLSMLVFEVRSIYIGYNDNIPFALVSLPTFFFDLALAGICLLSLIKFDKVLPHELNITRHEYKMKIIYSLHAVICLVTLAFPFIAYFAGMSQTYPKYFVIFFLAWGIGLEISISYTFLRALLKGRQGLTSSGLGKDDKLKDLNAMVFYIRVSYGVLFTLLVIYLGSGVLIMNNLITQDFVDAWGSLCVACYFTVYCHQKRIISKIYK